jgi:glycine cleavage system H protein
MEGFTRIDIFDTKGIEYIFVIGYLLILIVFWRIVTRQLKVRTWLQRTFGNLSADMLRIPQGILYNRNHTWIHLEESGTARIGLDDLLQHITGEVQFSHLRIPGELISKGDLLTEIHQEGKHLRIASPISGKILDTNSELSESPELLNEDPYKKGWIYKIKPSNWIAETNSCYLAEEATNWSLNELQRFKDFLAESMKKYSSGSSMVILQDGGELRDNTLSQLPSEVWQAFQNDFLSHTS